MSTLQFPKNPSINDEYDWEGFKYVYDGQKWKTIGVGYNPVNDLKDKLEPRIDELEDDVTQLQSGNSSLVQAVNSLNVRVTAEEEDTKDWEGFTAELLAQAGIVDDGQPDEIGNSKRVDAINAIGAKRYVISFKNEFGYSAVENMIAGRISGISNSVVHMVGNIYSTGGTVWECKVDVASEIGDFTALSTISVEDFGAKGDGVSSDTASIQMAINSAHGRKVAFNGGKKYFLTFVDGPQGKMCLDVPSNVTLDFNSAEIKCETNNFTNYQIINLYKKKNVILNDPRIIGDVDSHTGTDGEAGYGILVRCCEDVEINRPYLSKCWGDGLLIGSDSVSTNKNIVVNHGVFDDNRRQGSSVGGGIGIVYNDCTFMNTGMTKSTAPSAGIDIEPDGNKVADIDVKVNNCRFIGNKGGAAHVIISGCLSAPTLTFGICKVNIKFNGCTSLRDSSYLTTEARGSIRVGGTSATSGTNKLIGSIDFNSFTIDEPAIDAVWLTNPIRAYPPISFNDLIVNDVFSGVPLGSSMPTSSIIRFDIFPQFSTTPGFEIGDIDFVGLTYRDSRGSTFSSTATTTNHRVKRPVWDQNLGADISLARVRFREFKTEIQPDSLNFLMNGERGDYCSFDDDTMFANVNASILTSNVGETWGLGITPIITGSGSSTFVIDLPSTNGRVGTYQTIKVHMDGARPLQFRPGTTDGAGNQVLYLDGTRTSSQKTMAQSAGEFRFYCPVNGLWVQL